MGPWWPRKVKMGSGDLLDILTTIKHVSNYSTFKQLLISLICHAITAEALVHHVKIDEKQRFPNAAQADHSRLNMASLVNPQSRIIFIKHT